MARSRRKDASSPRQLCVWLALLCAGWLAGCGTTKSQLAKEQMLMSDAVDAAVSHIDFRSLSGEKVYFDTTYIQNIKGVGFVNSEYIISALRQQMAAADCRLQENANQADFIVEARVGTLGTNGHEIVYGMPANNALSTAATLLPNAPPLPVIPEISVARRDSQMGAAKIAVFAYERASRRPVWQSGISRATSTAQDLWLLGAGPFQSGSLYDAPQFAGSRILPGTTDDEESLDAHPVAYGEEFHFPRSLPPARERVNVASHDEQTPAPVVDAAEARNNGEGATSSESNSSQEAKP